MKEVNGDACPLARLHRHVGERVTLAGWVHADATSAALPSCSSATARASPRSSSPGRPSCAPRRSSRSRDVVTAAQAPTGSSCTRRLPPPRGAASAPPLELRRPRLKETLPTILDHAPLALRHPRQRAPFEIAAAALRGFRATLDGLGFTEIATPKIVSGATEGGANVFALDYFGTPAFLAQSPQLYKQAMVGVFERVYETGPVFRAEPHDTTRHLAQYTSLDAELGFVRDHFDVMAVVRAAVAGMVDHVRRDAPGPSSSSGCGCRRSLTRSPRCTSRRRGSTTSTSLPPTSVGCARSTASSCS